MENSHQHLGLFLNRCELWMPHLWKGRSKANVGQWHMNARESLGVAASSIFLQFLICQYCRKLGQHLSLQFSINFGFKETFIFRVISSCEVSFHDNALMSFIVIHWLRFAQVEGAFHFNLNDNHAGTWPESFLSRKKKMRKKILWTKDNIKLLNLNDNHEGAWPECF